jgi:hypothetical protein
MSSLTSLSLPNLPTQSPPPASRAGGGVPAPPECLHGPVEDLGPWGRRALVSGVVLAHLAAAWALAQGRAPRRPPHPRRSPCSGSRCRPRPRGAAAAPAPGPRRDRPPPRRS